MMIAEYMEIRMKCHNSGRVFGCLRFIELNCNFISLLLTGNLKKKS